jgi:hypothetical protein
MVLSRALSLAAVTLVVGCSAMGPVAAQENLDAGKNPSQIFSGTCTACHKSARGLLKTVAPGSLQGFLRQHYTTSPEMAGALASYLISNGATDTRYGDKQKGAKDGKDGNKQTRSEAKPEANPETKPETDSAQGETERAGHSHKRLARPAETPDAGSPAAEGQTPQATGEHEGRKSKRLSKRGKPGMEEEAPKAPDRALDKPIEPANEETAAPAKPESAKTEPVTTETVRSQPAKPEDSARPVEAAKPAESPAQSANADAAKEQVNEALPPSLRRDPVPAVTPSAPTAAAPATPAAPPSVTASAPPPAPTEPSTPPEPPISH